MIKIKLTPSQKKGLKALQEEGGNIFLTGGPGTGKSFLITEYLRQAQEKIPVIASTGTSAILVGGRTFHSFFGLGIMQGGPKAVCERALKSNRLRRRLRDLRTIVIDEVSMLSYSAFDCSEKIARKLRKSESPWGGLRVIAVGDFAQLPPISRGGRKEWCFLGEAWEKSEFKKMELTEVMRTEDTAFLEILEDIRWGRASERVAQFLNERVVSGEEMDSDVPHIFPRRAETDAFNQIKLAEIEGPARNYETEYGGKNDYIDRLMKDAPIPPVIVLKEGALIMIRMNDPKQRFVNGTIGVIEEMHEEVLLVKLRKKTIELEPFSFTMLDGDGEEAAFAVNFPVTLAYASTIHKVQGTTLPRIHVSLKNLWEPGQAYVALSRAQSGDGVTLMDWDKHSIKADELVIEFYNGVNVYHGVPR